MSKRKKTQFTFGGWIGLKGISTSDRFIPQDLLLPFFQPANTASWVAEHAAVVAVCQTPFGGEMIHDQKKQTKTRKHLNYHEHVGNYIKRLMSKEVTP